MYIHYKKMPMAFHDSVSFQDIYKNNKSHL